MKHTLLTLGLIAALVIMVGCEKKTNDDEMKSVALSLRSLENRIEKIEKRMGTLEKAPSAKTEIQKVSTDGNVDEILEAFNEKLYNLEQMMVAAGFDVLSTNEDIEVSAMAELVEEKTMEKRREKYQTSMRELRDTQRKSDSDNYGAAFTELQEKTRFRWGGNRNESQEDREKRMQEMVQAREDLIRQYPDSYAAAQLRAETAAWNLMQNNYQDALNTYKDLMASSKGTEAVNEWGVRNVTGLQYSLANKAIEEGDYATARSIMKDLESSGDDLVMAFEGFGGGRGRGGRGGGPGGPGRGGFRMEDNLVSKNQAISRLNDKMNGK
ncbi:hypothetical protein IJS98_00015 [bacterium]|nr:hypothetical protein [bacterium]